MDLIDVFGRLNCWRPGRLLLALLLAPPLGASEAMLTRGQQMIDAGDAPQAVTLFRQAADRGEPAGQYGLGVLYYGGIGVEQDRQRAAELFLLAARADYPPALYNVGNAYLHGDGVAADPEAAEHWLQRAVDNGFDQARINLAVLLAGHRPTRWRRELAVAHLRYLAERGQRLAEEQLLALDEPVDYSAIVPDPQREPLRSEARIATLPGEAYTLQLFASPQAEQALRWLLDQRLAGRALLFRFDRQGETWTGALYGVYASAAEARETLGQMAESLRAAGPWVRRIDGVQRLIAARHDTP